MNGSEKVSTAQKIAQKINQSQTLYNWLEKNNFQIPPTPLF
jgi:hypothetical protein